MTRESLAASSLDPRSLMLARIAALAAVDAPLLSYELTLEAAADVGLDADAIRGILAGIAPIIGVPRVVSAVGKIAEALAIDLEEALQG